MRTFSETQREHLTTRDVTLALQHVKVLCHNGVWERSGFA